MATTRTPPKYHGISAAPDHPTEARQVGSRRTKNWHIFQPPRSAAKRYNLRHPLILPSFAFMHIFLADDSHTTNNTLCAGGLFGKRSQSQ
jgi:hypothetical protein